MTYRELLERCRIKPGWLGRREQKELDSNLKYRTWMEKLNEKYQAEKEQNQTGR